MTVPEIVAQPIEAIQKLYQRAGCPSADGDWGVTAHFESAIAALPPGELPCLNSLSVERVPHHSLVSFYGMVQDTLNPEYYVGAFRRPNGQPVTTKYGDPEMREIDDADGGNQPIVWERRPVVLVPVPGLSSWASTFISGRSCADAASGAASDHGVPAQHPDGSCQETPATQPPPQAPVSPQQATRPQRPKRERSLDADQAPPDAAGDAERGAAATPPPPPAGRGAGAAMQHPLPPPQLQEEDSMQDTDLAADQGVPGAGPTAGAAPGDDDAARPRTRRREDAGREGEDLVGDGGSCKDEAGATEAAGAGPGRQGAVDAAGVAAASTAAAGQAAAEEAPGDVPVGEVPGSCITYLYDNSVSPLLHEVVQVIGVLSHVPHFALFGYDNPDEALEQELASLELGTTASITTGGGGGALGPHGPPGEPGEPGDLSHSGRQREMSGGAAIGAERLADAAIRAAHPPTSQVMRLHAILVRRSPALVPPPPPSPPITADATALTDPAGSVAGTFGTAVTAPLRERAMGLLRLALGGDALAAEYVLLQLLSRAARTGRGDSAALGQLSLNLFRCPPGGPSAAADLASSCGDHSTPPLLSDRLGRGPSSLAAGLQVAVSCLVPLCVALPVTLQAFNGTSWAPTRDPVRERTLPSPLQLAPGTVVVLDETVMAAGQFSERGFKSFQALDALARRQELVYDFETSQHPIPVDLPLVVLTEGRSLLRDGVPVRLPLNATQPLPTVEAILAAAATDATTAPTQNPNAAHATDADGAAAATAAIQPSVASSLSEGVVGLTAVRAYLAAARQQEGYDLAEGMATTLEQYFVDARRAGGAGTEGSQAAANSAGAPGGMTPEEFHMKLTLARLLVLSHGETRLTRQRWQELLQLEHRREARLRVGA